MPKPNDPYSRPINATKPEGQMLQGEFYGEKATDKQLHRAIGGRPVHQVRPMVSVVPNWPEQPKPKPVREKKARGPKPDKVIVDEVPAEPQPEPITEDDLFG